MLIPSLLAAINFSLEHATTFFLPAHFLASQKTPISAENAYTLSPLTVSSSPIVVHKHQL